MASDNPTGHLTESGLNMHSDTEQYSPGDEPSTSPPSSSAPIILYKPPTVWSMIRSVTINLLLPFINGMMLGFGELFAHEAAFRLGWGGTKNSLNALSIRQGLDATRRFGTIRGSIASPNAASLSSSPFHLGRLSRYAAPLALGGSVWPPSSSRAFSLWGFGWSKKFKAGQKPADAATESSVEAASDKAAPTPPQDSLFPAQSTRPSAASKTTSTPHESTLVSDQAVTPPATSSTELAVDASDVDLSSLVDLVNDHGLNDAPNKLGYLHALGLDYGWGFTSTIQWILEHVHVWCGLDWGGSIIVTALLLRVATFYPQIRAAQFNAQMSTMRSDPRFTEAMELMTRGFQERNLNVRQQGQFLNNKVKKEHGIRHRNIVWALIQFPFMFGFIRLIRGMVAIPVPGLETAGFLWFQDLTIADPYFILPAISAALMLATIKLNSKYSTQSQQKYLGPLSYFITFLSLFFTSFMSAGFNLLTTTLGCASYAATLILGIPSLRRAFKLSRRVAANPTPRIVDAQAPRSSPSGLRERLSRNINDMKQGLTEQLGNYSGSYSSSAASKETRKHKEMVQKAENLRRVKEREAFIQKYKRNA